LNARTINSQRVLHIVVPARAEYLSLIRLVVAGIAARSGFSADSIADIKVALSEASSNVIRHAYATDTPYAERVIEINCYDDNGSLLLEVTDHGHGMPIPPPPSEGLGFGIMGSLMDKVDVETADDGTSVLMSKLSMTARR